VTLTLLVLCIALGIADIISQRVNERYGAEEGNALQRRADRKLSMPKAILIKSGFIGLCFYGSTLNPQLGYFGLGATAISQGMTVYKNLRWYQQWGPA
jgi:hypothetical protein